MGIPLAIVVFVSALKSLFEDLRRHKSDNQENNRKVFVWRNNNFVLDKWSSLRVGDIVKV
jgi:phospholipid-transporting ATPase